MPLLALLERALPHPALDAVRAPARALIDAGSLDVASLDRTLGPRCGLRFERQITARRRGPARVDALYEGRVAVDRRVPTREGSLHDVMNALAFAAFPESKPALHGRQHASLRARLGETAARLPGARTREQDALAMLDEGGLLLLAGEARAPRAQAALEAGDHAALGALIEAGEASAIVLGHAITEHVALGLPAPRASTYVLTAPSLPCELGERVALADALLARALGDPSAFTEPPAWRGVSIESLLT